MTIWEAKARHEAGLEDTGDVVLGLIGAPCRMAELCYQGLCVAAQVNDGRDVTLVPEVPVDER
jgi:hypothetical protein